MNDSSLYFVIYVLTCIVYFTKLSVDFLRPDGDHGNATDEIWIRKDFEGSGRG